MRVELGARHLIRLRLRCLGGGGEVGVLLDRAVRGDERRAPLVDEAGARERLVEAELAPELAAPRQLRLADVKRGNASRSSTSTRRPRRASAVAAAAPPGPPPTMITSYACIRCEFSHQPQSTAR